jgi:hypothetical protein
MKRILNTPGSRNEAGKDKRGRLLGVLNWGGSLVKSKKHSPETNASAPKREVTLVGVRPTPSSAKLPVYCCMPIQVVRRHTGLVRGVSGWLHEEQGRGTNGFRLVAEANHWSAHACGPSHKQVHRHAGCRLAAGGCWWCVEFLRTGQRAETSTIQYATSVLRAKLFVGHCLMFRSRTWARCDHLRQTVRNSDN